MDKNTEIITDEKYDGVLLIDDAYENPLCVNEGQEIKPILKKFMESYAKKTDDVSLEDWLSLELKENLPEKDEAETRKISTEIITTLNTCDDKLRSLESAAASGRSKESWFAKDVAAATSHMSTQQSAEYMHALDAALSEANDSLYRTITTQAGLVNQNPSLDGFIAEQYHAQTFNMNAAAKGSEYRAKVLEPNGTGYGKNSVDIVITDANDKIIRKYQAKVYKDPESARNAFEHGDYRGQRKLVADGQENLIGKKATNVLEAPDGTTSNPLSKSRAKEMQNEAQSGNWNELNWNEYQAKDLAIGIGKQAGQAALLGAAIGAGMNVAQKVWNGEKIDGEEVVKTAITTGADFGVKAAVAGAVKVGVEKGVVSCIPKGTPAGTIANIVQIGVENAKVIGKMATGELTPREGIDRMEQVTVSTVAGIAAAGEGFFAGSCAGLMIAGPIGAVVGGFVGGSVGYMAGSKVGEAIVKVVQKIRKKAEDMILTVGRSVASGVRSVARGIGNAICSLFGL